MRSGTRWAAALVLMAIFAIGGCEREGPAEQAGEEVDEAVEETGEGVEELGEGAEEQTDGMQQ